MAKDPVSEKLIAVFSAEFEPYLMRRLDERGTGAVDGIAEAIAEARSWLESTLEGLLSLPYSEQGRSPLEVFQEAMAGPTRLLERVGTPQVPRQDAAVAALPGDLYDLAPASSQEISEAAWSAHLGWGAAKAAAMVGPTAVVVTRNLMDGSRLESAIQQAGYQVVSLPRTKPPSVALVDLEHPDSDDAIRQLVEAGSFVVAYGPHVDDFALTRARTLGAREAVARSVLFRSPAALLPELM